MSSAARKVGKNLKIGMIFPGQGSQHLGMGKAFYDTERVAQEMFDDASAALKENFVQLCFASSDKILHGTIITQTAIFLVSATIYEVLKQKYGIVPDMVAGHSLGEYTAVYAAGGMNFFDTLYLLNKRAEFMQAALNQQNGGLLAVMNIDDQRLLEMCARYDDPADNKHVAELAIFNSPTQKVISGTLPELEQVAQDVEILRGKSVKLPVAGAFHSRMLRQAEEMFAMYLLKVDFNPLQIPLINNVMAQKIVSPEAVKLSIVKQTSSHIFWWQSMEHFAEMDLIIEVGPSDKFSKMLQREWPNKPIFAVNNHADVKRLLAVIDKIDAEK